MHPARPNKVFMSHKYNMNSFVKQMPPFGKASYFAISMNTQLAITEFKLEVYLLRRQKAMFKPDTKFKTKRLSRGYSYALTIKDTAATIMDDRSKKKKKQY